MARMNRDERAARLCTEHGLFTADAGFVVDEQDRREGPLVEALRELRGWVADDSTTAAIIGCALAAWEALDAKPEPTVAECTREAIEAWDAYDRTDEKLARLNRALAALKAAVEREERKGK